MPFLKRYKWFTLIQLPIHIWVPPLVYCSTTGVVDMTLALKASARIWSHLPRKQVSGLALKASSMGSIPLCGNDFLLSIFTPCVMWSQTVNFDFFMSEQTASVVLRWLLLKTGEIRWCATVSITCVHVYLSAPSQCSESSTSLNTNQFFWVEHNKPCSKKCMHETPWAPYHFRRCRAGV